MRRSPLLQNPRIVVLDEATSALDTLTERQIQSALARVTEGRTTIVIAHRLSTIVAADEIIVLRGGVAAERGSHDDLLRQGGEYARLWEQQSHEQDDAGNATDGAGTGNAGAEVDL